MATFFTILYIKTNRLSDEKIAVGLLSNISDLPEFQFSNYKLNFALHAVNPNLRRAIKKSLQRLKNDVNQYINGETSIPMFDVPYAKKLLEKLVLKKRGVLFYGELFQLEKPVEFIKLYEKYVSKNLRKAKVSYQSTQTFKKQFNQYISGHKFGSFSSKKWISDEEYPLLSSPVQVDLFRLKNGFTVFKTIDFNLTEKTIQQHIATFRMVVESLSEYSSSKGLSKGRYYLVYDPPKSEAKRGLVNKVKLRYKSFELIRMSEMMDKT